MACPTCHRCLHWTRINVHSNLGECALFETSGGDKVHAEARLFATATQSGECTIMTHSDFGCVQATTPFVDRERF